MRREIGVVLACAAWGCSSSHSTGAATLSPPDVPAAIQAPADEHVAGRFHVVANETFACQQQTGDAGVGYAWTSVAFDAKIEDWDTNAVIGVHTHTPAPTFTSNDGSVVVGKPVAMAPSPDGAGPGSCSRQSLTPERAFSAA